MTMYMYVRTYACMHEIFDYSTNIHIQKYSNTILDIKILVSKEPYNSNAYNMSVI